MNTASAFTLYLLAPHSSETRRSQREIFLLIILIGSAVFTGSTAISSWIEGIDSRSASIFGLLCLSLMVGFYLVRANKSRLVSYAIVALYLIASLFTSSLFGVSTPQILLSDVLILVISGILINIRFAIILSIVFSLLISALRPSPIHS